jgi:hypothetical protein
MWENESKGLKSNRHFTCYVSWIQDTLLYRPFEWGFDVFRRAARLILVLSRYEFHPDKVGIFLHVQICD